ncbi:MAG TPA: ABC transporter permease [Cyclobacteriaceae bacterium]|nr:ABC transporter permease [Cyclobacteriaceae bacterium]
MRNQDPSPPKYVLRFFRWYCHPSLLPAIEGDLVELYRERIALSGKRRADLNFLFDVILLFRPGIIRPTEGHKSLNQYGMFKSYVKIGWRNLVKSKGYSLINIGGLAIGMAAAILIGLWLHFELTFNQNFGNYDRIARVIQHQDFNGVIQTWNSQAKQLGPELRDYYGSNFKHVVVTGWIENHKISYNDKSIRYSGNWVEPGLPDMLELKMLKGTRSGLKDMHSIMLSASASKAIFGDEDPMDKSLKLNDKNDVKVTGVYEDLPASCDFAGLGFVAPFELHERENLPDWVEWGNSWFQCFVQLEDNVALTTANENIHEAKLKRVRALGSDDDRFKPELMLHPMSRWHLYSNFENGAEAGGAIRYVWMFGTIGFFVLLLACINFMNLSTARAERRAKEVGIRKTVGSLFNQLVRQFYTESFMVVGLAMLISLVLAQASMPWFNGVSGKNLFMPWASPVFWMAVLGFTFIVGAVSGSYPAFYLSSFKPVKALKSAIRPSRGGSLPRKIMVVVQFSISVVLIISTAVIVTQIEYAQNRPLGYDNRGIIVSPIRSDDIRNHFDAFSNDLKSTGAVNEVAFTDTHITDTGVTNSGFFWKGKADDMNDEFWTLRTAGAFGKLMNWEIIEGREFGASDTSSFIINESAARYMGMKSPVGEVVRWGSGDGAREYTIIGVVKDMIMQSPYQPVRQMIFVRPEKQARMTLVNIKINADANVVDAIASIEKVFRKHDPNNAFEYTFADQDYARKFKEERRVASLSSGLALLAVFICCLGLFGLASYMAEQRTKEIGIRKVLGASIGNLWRMMSKDFVILVVIAGVIALPPAYFLSVDWLSQFQYRVPLSWLIFAGSIGGALLIALLTVSYHALRSAMANPVRSLRSE